MRKVIRKLHEEIEEATLTPADYNLKKQTTKGEVKLKQNELENKQKELLGTQQIINEKQALYSTIDQVVNVIPSYQQSDLYKKFHDMLARR